MRNLGWEEIEDVTWMYSGKKKKNDRATFGVHGARAQSFNLDGTTCTHVNINATL